jgi:hypothetical protein
VQLHLNCLTTEQPLLLRQVSAAMAVLPGTVLCRTHRVIAQVQPAAQRLLLPVLYSRLCCTHHAAATSSIRPGWTMMDHPHSHGPCVPRCVPHHVTKYTHSINIVYTCSCCSRSLQAEGQHTAGIVAVSACHKLLPLPALLPLPLPALHSICACPA